jgi:vacuolar protein sorting-associated protein 13A/C
VEAQFSQKTLSFSNTRAGNSVFRDIMPAAEHDGNQVYVTDHDRLFNTDIFRMVQYTQSGGSVKSSLAIVTVDSPRFTLAVEPLAALLEFAVSPFKKAATEEDPATDPQVVEEPIEGPSDSRSSLAFRVEIIDSTVIVVADDTNLKSQAIQLSIKEVLVSQQGILALKLDHLGMSFGRMDRPTDRVRFLDDVNIALSLDTRRRGSQRMTILEAEIPDPIVFRASYSDMMLIMNIINEATAGAQRALSPPAGPASKRQRRRSSAGALETIPTTATSTSVAAKASTRRTSISERRGSVETSRVLVSKEQFKARINGFQFVLVGDLQEMPFVHLSTNEFTILVNDWSGDMKAGTSITTSIRYFDLANSHFEPLMDPWRFDVRATRMSSSPTNSSLSVRLTAAERLELNVTSAFIELAITTMTLWSKEADRVKDSKGSDAPFRVRNRTGLPILIWPESRDLNKPVSGVKKLDDGADVPWRFEDRRRTRDVSAL